VVDELFRRYVSVDEATFSRELYMDITQIRCLLRNGMEIGGHGDRHEHMAFLSRERLVEELYETRAFLSDVHGEPARDWTMCFPYGSFAAESLDLAADLGCRTALSCKADLVRLPIDFTNRSLHVLHRLDTNDLPSSPNAPPCEWTLRAHQSFE
jgi:peptidoglycan/xylan/chitin deacetylase (PgdA/CDA1 family)